MLEASGKCQNACEPRPMMSRAKERWSKRPRFFAERTPHLAPNHPFLSILSKHQPIDPGSRVVKVKMSFATPALPFGATIPVRIASASRCCQRRGISSRAQLNRPSIKPLNQRQHAPQLRVSNVCLIQDKSCSDNIYISFSMLLPLPLP